MILEIIGHNFLYAIEHVVRIFYPYSKIEIAYMATDKSENTIKTVVDKSNLTIFVSVALDDFSDSNIIKYTENINNQELKLKISQLLFELLIKKTNRYLPWGMLTGVRPVSLFHKQRQQGKTITQIKDHFKKEYYISNNKIDLAIKTMNNQTEIFDDRSKNKDFCLYVSIPFCPTRCSYCSFISTEVGNDITLIDDYLKLLTVELKYIGELVKDLGLKLNAVYIGGGTPTILNSNQLEELLNQIQRNFDVKNKEFTIEAGRPDTINHEKLLVSKSFGVNRVSINTQTLNQNILDNINRKHTVKQFYDAFELARKTGFSVINVDLILGLQGESERSFLSGLANILKLKPENMTIHALTIKRSSGLKQSFKELGITSDDLSSIMTKAEELVFENEYLPYYLYRQKGTLENLENVGFTTTGNSCYYNIVMMEETQTVIAAGAGANTRLKINEVIKRVYSYKYPLEYIKNFENILLRKGSIKEFYENY